MRFSQGVLDEIKSRLRPSDVIGRSVKLKRQGREWAGLSPFTNEKTPSFFVNDDKGQFFCFSSGRSGDIISFLQETERLSFQEAVETLAAEAGVMLAPETPQDRAREAARTGLAEACEAAAKYFRDALHRSEGREALAYLERRGVSAETMETFGIGYAPNSRSGLKDYLLNKGFKPETLIEAGLLIRPEDGGAPYDRFRNRVMFPILGAKDRVIAFGGRALDPKARAKYLNSPETPLFHKGAVLFNGAAARRALADVKGEGLIVVEGYMDVIALAQAGFQYAVAPLGTALTETQIELLWRAGPEPVLCFDGDRAGLGAAHRAIDRALPLLKPGQSLRFAFLPEGLDPDDMIREKGARAMGEALGASATFADVLWARESTEAAWATPERRAALKRHLRELVGGIADEDVKSAYLSDMMGRIDQERDRRAPKSNRREYAPRAFGATGRGGFQGPGRDRRGPSAELLQRAAARRAQSWPRKDVLLIGAVARFPELLDRVGDEFAEVQFADDKLEAVRRRILDVYAGHETLDRAALGLHLSQTECAGTMERLDRDDRLNFGIFAQTNAPLDDLECRWRDIFSQRLQGDSLSSELRDAAADLAREPTETVMKRLRALKAHREALHEAGGGADQDGESSDL